MPTAGASRGIQQGLPFWPESLLTAMIRADKLARQAAAHLSVHPELAGRASASNRYSAARDMMPSDVSPAANTCDSGALGGRRGLPF